MAVQVRVVAVFLFNKVSNTLSSKVLNQFMQLSPKRLLARTHSQSKHICKVNNLANKNFNPWLPININDQAAATNSRMKTCISFTLQAQQLQQHSMHACYVKMHICQLLT